MRLKFIKTMAGPGGTYQPGQVVEIDDGLAREIVQAGAAVPVVEQQARAAVITPAEVRDGDSSTADGADSGAGGGAGPLRRSKRSSKG